MTSRQTDYLIAICEKLGIYDYEGFYILSMIAIDLIVTIIVYALLTKLWRRHRPRR